MKSLPAEKKLVATLKAEAKKCKRLYLATDLDREGEAIAWHLSQVLGVDDERTNRVVFNEITKKAIEQAFANPGKVDIDKVMVSRRVESSTESWAIKLVRCSGKKLRGDFPQAVYSLSL
jgi:DNA topoisomerase IA